MTFKQWMREVDSILESNLGIGYMDLVDQCWRDMFDDGLSPGEATSDIIRDPYSYA